MRKATELKLVLYLVGAAFLWSAIEAKVQELGWAGFLLTVAGITVGVVAGVYALRSAGRAVDRAVSRVNQPPRSAPKYQLTEEEISKMDPVNQAFMRERIERERAEQDGAEPRLETHTLAKKI